MARAPGMSDAFARLDLPRRPWLEEDAVRAAFQVRAAAAHPDRAGATGEFAALAAAAETLREPVDRLRHLLALEAPEVAIPEGVPGELMSWFPRVGAALAELKKAVDWKGGGPLQQALLAGAIRSGEGAVSEVKALWDEACGEIRRIDATWPAPAWEDLARLAARLRFIGRWLRQLEEAVLLLRL